MQIKEICDKYDIDGVYERFASSCDEKIEVGFLGEFSSDKSSLLNSILEQDLDDVNSIQKSANLQRDRKSVV